MKGIAFKLLLFNAYVVSIQIIWFVNGHGFMETPRQRGILEMNPFTAPPPILTNLPPETYDYKCQFPAGNKEDWPGAGVESQKMEGYLTGWTPYEPWNPQFVFRSGVCGDVKWNPEHMRNGRYYYPQDNPRIVSVYEQGGVIDIDVTITTWHMGFFEFTICDVEKCGGEISEECLRNTEICQRLIREPVPECETGYNLNCAPIDPFYPTRWYAPCPYPTYTTVMRWGHGLMKYRLPPNLHCEHCVLQWYWVSATECNPTGVIEYFRGPRGPRWNHCPNFDNQYNGFGDFQPCGSHFPEEYYQCADVKVIPRIQSLNIISNGEILGQVRPREQRWFSIQGKPIALEAVIGQGSYSQVVFSVEGREDWISTSPPYVYLGTSGIYFKTWDDPIQDRWFSITITAVDENNQTFRFFALLFFSST